MGYLYFINILIGILSLFIVKRKYFIINNIFFSTHIIFFFLLVVVGSFYVYYPEFSPYENADFFSTKYFLVLTSYQLILLFFCLILAKKKISSENSLINSGKIRLKKIYYFFPLILSVSIVSKYLVSNGLPIFYKIINSGLSNNEIIIQRTLFFKEQQSFFINEIGFFICPTIMTIYSFTRNFLLPTKWNLFYFILNLLIASVLSLSFFHKTPLLLLVFSILCCYFILNKPKVSLKKGLFYSLLIFSIILIQYYFVLHNQVIISIGDVLNGVANRIFGVYPLGLAVAISLPSETGFYLGDTIPNILGLNPNGVNMSQVIHFKIFGVEGDAPSPAIGYAYANWGFLGVIFDVIFTSLFLILSNQLLLKIKNSFIKVLIICIAIPQIMFVSMSSVFDSIINPRDILIISIIVIIMMLKFRTNYE